MTGVAVVQWFLIITMTIILTTFDCMYHFISHQDNSVGSYSFACGSSETPSVLEAWIQQVSSFSFSI